jgi:hypothetical protein
MAAHPGECVGVVTCSQHPRRRQAIGDNLLARERESVSLLHISHEPRNELVEVVVELPRFSSVDAVEQLAERDRQLVGPLGLPQRL